MKNTICTLFSLGLLATAQETTTPPASTETAPVPADPAAPPVAKPEKPQYILDLESLSKEEAQAYGQAFLRADTLFKQKRIFECLEAIEEIHAIYDGNPSSLNLKGACYVEFRAFDKARIAFAKAAEVTPDNFNVRFNLAEIEFVTKDYPKSLGLLEELAKEASDNDNGTSMLPLIHFKILLCKLKTGDEAGARAIIAKTDFLDDSPLFYYGNAALDYFSEKGGEAEAWLARAGRIFGATQNGQPSQILSPWHDTLIEVGYIESFYGGDLEVTPLSPVDVEGE